MFPPSNGLIVSDDVAQIGDALLTLVRHEVRQETPEATSRRRLETFVLSAQTLVARLAERQEDGFRQITEAERREAFLRYQLGAVLRWQGETDDRLGHVTTDLTTRLEAHSEALVQVTDTLRRLSLTQGRLEDRLIDAHDRIAALEARTLRGRWRRFVQWIRRRLR